MHICMRTYVRTNVLKWQQAVHRAQLYHGTYVRTCQCTAGQRSCITWRLRTYVHQIDQDHWYYDGIGRLGCHEMKMLTMLSISSAYKDQRLSWQILLHSQLSHGHNYAVHAHTHIYTHAHTYVHAHIRVRGRTLAGHAYIQAGCMHAWSLPNEVRSEECPTMSLDKLITYVRTYIQSYVCTSCMMSVCTDEHLYSL